MNAHAAQPDVLVLQECNGFELDGFRTLYAVERELGMRGVLGQAQSGFHVALFVRDGRINVAGMNAASMDRLCDAIVSVL